MGALSVVAVEFNPRVLCESTRNHRQSEIILRVMPIPETYTVGVKRQISVDVICYKKTVSALLSQVF